MRQPCALGNIYGTHADVSQHQISSRENFSERQSFVHPNTTGSHFRPNTTGSHFLVQPGPSVCTSISHPDAFGKHRSLSNPDSFGTQLASAYPDSSRNQNRTASPAEFAAPTRQEHTFNYEFLANPTAAAVDVKRTTTPDIFVSCKDHLKITIIVSTNDRA